jgi:Mrp family chromosome partitioning ATPase
LPSGPLPPNPADLLSTGRIRKIINEAKEGFDLVVLDGPPTIGLADAPLLAAAAGSALFVIESGKTRTRAAIEALNRLESTGTRIAGAVLTKSQDSGDGYGYAGYGYGYGTRGRIKRTEILMIPHDDSDRELSDAEADG